MYAFIETILNMVYNILSALSGYIDSTLSTNVMTLEITVYNQSITLLDFATTIITIWLVSWVTYKVIMLPMQVIRKVKEL